MKKLNENGQVAIGIIVIIGVVAFILLSNLQTQQNLMSRQILEARSRMELESAIDLFGKELYKAYILSAPIPDSIIPNMSWKAGNAQTKDGTLNFYIAPDTNGDKKICLKRILDKVTNTDVPLCIKLPDSFITWLKMNQDSYPNSNYAKNEMLNYLINIKQAHAQIGKFPFGLPDPNLLPLVKTTRDNISPSEQLIFDNEYTKYNCNPTADLTIKCVTIQICIRPSGCRPANDNSDKVIQSFIFNKVPTTQLRE